MFWKISQNSQLSTRSSHPELRCQRKKNKNFAKFTEKHLHRSLLFNKVASWEPETVRISHWRCSVKQGLLKNFANFTGKNHCKSLFVIKLQFRWPATFLKKILTQVLSCEIYKLFKNNYFEEHLWMSASKFYLEKDYNTSMFLWILGIIQEHLFCRGPTNGWFWNTSAGVSLQQRCKPVGLKAVNSIRKRLQHRYFSVNFVKFLGKLFCKTHTGYCFSHDVVFFSFLQISKVCSLKPVYLVEQW